MHYLACPDVFVAVYDNSVNALIPQNWAMEFLAILEENMVATQLVHRDFEKDFAKWGDTVHTRRPRVFEAQFKTVNDDVTIQDATADDVAIEMKRIPHVSFLIRDGEETQSMTNLVQTFIAPAALGMARKIDRITLGQYSQFLGNVVGGLGTLTSTNVAGTVTDLRRQMNLQKAFMDGRNLIWTPNSEGTALKASLFVGALQTGSTIELTEGVLGRKFGFDNYMCQNMASIATGNTVKTGAVNNGAGYSAGTDTLTVDLFTGAVSVGEWLTIAGDNTPYRVKAHTETLGNTTQIQLHTGLRHDVVDDAVITAYTPGNIDAVSGYVAGYGKTLTIDNFSVAPQIGQAVSFGVSATSPVYTVVGRTGLTSIELDRPLEGALSDDDNVNIGPAGDYNFAFHRAAISLVVRPLAPPNQTGGVNATVVDRNGLAMRVTVWYDGVKQGHLVTIDCLVGVKVLDLNLGAVLLG